MPGSPCYISDVKGKRTVGLPKTHGNRISKNKNEKKEKQET